MAVGAGPSNLSLAALAVSMFEPRVRVLESRSSAAWHPGLLLPRSRLQGSFLRDLVTPVDPRSEYSFINYLHVMKRLNGFLTAHRDSSLRVDFSGYFEWVAQQVHTSFSEEVVDIAFDGDSFIIESAHQTLRAKNIVSGSGAIRFVPNDKWLTIKNVWHASEHLSMPRQTSGNRVAIVGGGQSAAELFLHLVDTPEERPRELIWLTGRGGLLPLDQSAFTDEFFQPSYGMYFSALPAERKPEIVARQHTAISGISREVLQELYARVYALDAFEPTLMNQGILAGSEAVDLTPAPDGTVDVVIREVDCGQLSSTRMDAVILATGYRKSIPPYLSSLMPKLDSSDGALVANSIGRVGFDGPASNGLYLHSGPSMSAGVGGQTLGLVSWRSARILNDIADEPVFDLLPEWSAQSRGTTTFGSPINDHRK
ncbi:SidA/IucD/PvdA family monooxygenase [Rathayibacter iranicus]|uniref:SidA/IucD/PvdA family monooxygenase n=1 Tax=Rathayibacter iranicus TaxID=59737 RepID=UPI001365385D|nr:SidA/IucD/PvdA family monooxygenase [Rathayibacter iranicus]